MKNLIATVALLLTATTAMAADRSFTQCLSERLQAYNSSIYYNMSREELVDILDDSGNGLHSTVKQVAKSCLEDSN